MAKFNTAQSFSDGDSVTGAKLNNITSQLNIYTGVISEQTAMVATVSTADQLLIADTDNGDSGAANRVTVQKLFSDSLTNGTFASFNLTGTITSNRTVATSATITTGTIPTLVSSNATIGTTTGTAGVFTSGTITTGLIPTLTVGTTTGTAGIFTSGTIATLNSTTGTIATLVATNNATIQGINIGRGAGNVAGNTSLGSSALASNTTGYSNVAIGANALQYNTTGSQNTANGVSALESNTTGYQNTANGIAALYSNSTGFENTAVGIAAMYNNTTGYQNTAIGRSALRSNTTGYVNTAIGYLAGEADGINSNTTGTNNSFIGHGSVGASATASNVITLGDASIATLRCQVTAITALSDGRDKSDVKDLSAGLDFVGKLRPVSFVWNTRDKAKVNIPDSGFIAQELLEVQNETGIVIPNLVSQENPEKLEAAYGTLIPVLVKAIKELKSKVQSLEKKLK